jgi:hypothetical protein
MSKELRTRPFVYTPQTLDEAMKYCQMIANSDVVPKDFKGKPGNVLIAVQMGGELGLSPMQAIQNVAVINGRPCLWGDAIVAVCQAHPDYEWHKEWYENDTAHCTVKRRGAPEYTYSFGMKEVVSGGYDKKQGPWQTDRKRMMQMRARRAFRDQFADALKGLYMAEEAIDIEQVEATVTEPIIKNTAQVDKLKDKLINKPHEQLEAEMDTEVDAKITGDDKRELNAMMKEKALSNPDCKTFFEWLGGNEITQGQLSDILANFDNLFDKWFDEKD